MTVDDSGIRGERNHRIQKAMRTARPVRADEDYRRRLKQQFVTGEFPPRREQDSRSSAGRWRRWAWALVPATALLLLLLLILPAGPEPSWKMYDVLGHGRIVIDDRATRAGDPTLRERSIGAGTRVEIAEGVVLDLLLDDTLLLELAEGADVDLPRRSGWGAGRPLIAEVRAGELRLETGPGFSGQRLRILTAEGITDLVGTIVSLYKGRGFTCVCVYDGQALIGSDEDRLQRIPGGMRKMMFADGREALVTAIEPQHEQELQEFLERHEGLFGGR